MSPDDLAELHALCFDFAPRPWSAGEFRSLLDSANVALLSVGSGFVLTQFLGDEVEILTIAVHPAQRRRRIAAGLLSRVHENAMESGIGSVFLEVSERNTGAMALYESLGYERAGARKGYYRDRNGNRITAVVMKRDLTKGKAELLVK